MPIQPTVVDVVGIHPEHADCLVVRVSLSHPPPTRWRELFRDVGLDLPRIAMREPVIDGPSVLLTTPDGQLEDEVAHVEARVRLANARFLVEMRRPRPASAPMVQKPNPAVVQESFSDDVRTRIQAARHRAADMSGVYLSGGFTAEDSPLDFSDTYVEPSARRRAAS